MIKRIFAAALALALSASAALAGSNFDWAQLQAMNKAAFLGLTASVASAGNISCGELWNPAASGKVVLVWTVTVSETVSGSVQIGTTTTELTSGASTSPGNKYAGASAGVVLLRVQQPASFAFTGGTDMWSQPLTASTPQTVPMKGPVVLPAGFGLATCTTTVNDQINTSFEWDEISG